ncbi:MAG: substrate-binding domain-containing protein [Lachnospiraceae bacterium]|nr:substrate-binding domain-containing protein [Lachnospiraceae bacterium]
MKNFRNNISLLTMIVLLAAFVVTAILLIDKHEPKKQERTQVSLIVYGDDSERWENLREGAGLVCGEKDADLSLLTMLSENDVSEQEEIILREVEDGTDAMIIAACNSGEIKDFIKSRNLKIPVIFVESVNEETKTVDCIAPDDYMMGYELGETIAKYEGDIVTVAIISDNTQRDSLSLREKGLRDAIEGKVGRILTWTRSDAQKSVKTRMFIQKAIVSEATDVIVAFDNTTTDALIDALENLNQTSKVYSISTSNKAVYNLYNKEIRALEYPDEFSMGYLAAMYALDRSYADKKYSDKEIEYRLVRKENMYDEDNQALLFPFVN